MKSAKVGLIEKIKLKIKTAFIKHKPVNKQGWIRLGVLVIAVPVFIYSSSMLVYRLYTYIYEDYKNRQIIEMRPPAERNPFDEFIDDETGKTPKEDDTDDWGLPYRIIYGTDSYLNENGILAEYQDLWERNNDMVGWIFFPGVRRRDINYPVLQGQDNIFYLNYDFDKNRSYSGSIYMDYRNTAFHKNPLDIDRNYIITGHAMRDFTMFGGISSYWHFESMWESARYIYVDLLNTRLMYEVASAFVTYPQFNYKQVHFSDDEEYQKYLNTLIAKSNNDFGIELTADDKIVTLETCYLTSQRTVIVGRLIKQIIYEKPERTDNEDEEKNGLEVTPIALPTDIPMNVPSPTPGPPQEDVDAAENVFDMIDLLPDLEDLTKDDSENVYAAAKAYEKLTDNQKKLVENKDILFELVEEMDLIMKEIIDREKADAVIDLIEKIPGLEDLTKDDSESVYEAALAYEELTDDQKILVENSETLFELIEKMDIIMANTVIDLINEIPDLETLTEEHREAVNLARKEYDKLTGEQQELVTNYKKLYDSEEKLGPTPITSPEESSSDEETSEESSSGEETKTPEPEETGKTEDEESKVTPEPEDPNGDETDP